MRKLVNNGARREILDPADLQQILNRITSQLSTSSGPDALFRAVVDIAMATTDAQASSLYLEQTDTSPGGHPRLVMVEGAGYERKRVGKASYAKGEGLTGSIWDRSETVKFDTTEALETSGTTTSFWKTTQSGSARLWSGYPFELGPGPSASSRSKTRIAPRATLATATRSFSN